MVLGCMDVAFVRILVRNTELSNARCIVPVLRQICEQRGKPLPSE